MKNSNNYGKLSNLAEQAGRDFANSDYVKSKSASEIDIMGCEKSSPPHIMKVLEPYIYDAAYKPNSTELINDMAARAVARFYIGANEVLKAHGLSLKGQDEVLDKVLKSSHQYLNNIRSISSNVSLDETPEKGRFALVERT